MFCFFSFILNHGSITHEMRLVVEVCNFHIYFPLFLKKKKNNNILIVFSVANVLNEVWKVVDLNGLFECIA